MGSNISGRAAASPALVLVTGTALSQIVNLAITPIITRLYEPADFGLFGLYFAYFSVALVVVTWRYELAIVGARTEGDAWELVALCGIVLPPMAGFAAAGLLVIELVGVGEFGALPWPSPLLLLAGLLVGGTLAVLRFVAVRRNEFVAVSAATVQQGLARAVGQLAFGLLGAGSVGLMAADGLARLAGARRLHRASDGVGGRLRSLSSTRIKAAARVHWRFPVLSVPSSLLDTLSSTLPAPLIASLFGISPAGQFFLVQRVLALPLALVGASVADIFHARLAEEVRTGTGTGARLVLRTSALLFLIGLPVAVAIIWGGEFLFALVFGEPWRSAGQVAAIVAPWTLAQLVVSPLSRTIYVVNGQFVKLAFDFASIGASVGGLAGAAAFGLDFLGAVRVLTSMSIAANVLYLLLILHLARQADRRSVGA